MGHDVVLLCNGANFPEIGEGCTAKHYRLDYRNGQACDQQIRIKIPKFTQELVHLPPRILDLLEIAAYVYAADRLYKRGTTDQLEFSGWSRKFHFVIQVSDYAFWSKPAISKEMGSLLEFLSGDALFEFTFEPGFTRHPTSLFDGDASEELPNPSNVEVALFSGGLDSMAGALEILTSSLRSPLFVSHKSGSTAITRTQRQLVSVLRARFPERIRHIEFESGLTGIHRAPEETQRARFFLYTCIALGVSLACKQNSISVYENGMTSIHFRKRQDQLNARSTRTTHPRTIRMLQNFFQQVADSAFEIRTPFFWFTKTDIVQKINDLGGADLFSSTVSCGKTIRTGSQTHCGGCSQCVDRRIAAYAAGLADRDDEGLYNFDFARDPITDQQPEALMVINDFFFQAAEFKNMTEDGFAFGERLAELAEVAQGLPQEDPDDLVTKVYELCKRHGNQAFKGYEAMRAMHGDPSQARDSLSLYAMVETGKHLRPPHEALSDRIETVLRDGLRLAFQRRRPDHENVLNDEIEALLGAAGERIHREFPHIQFATKQSVPDHASEDCSVLVEAKMIRKTGGLRTATNEMAADVTLYGESKFIFFLIYDPLNLVKRELAFVKDFEKTGRCRVCLVR